MAKREEEIKKKEALEELEASQVPPLTKSNVEFSLQNLKKKKLRKKLRKSKSAIGPSRSQFSRSFIFDSKRDKDKASVKVSCRIKHFSIRLLIAQENFSSLTRRRQQQQTPPNIAKRRAEAKRCQSRLLQFTPSTDPTWRRRFGSSGAARSWSSLGRRARCWCATNSGDPTGVSKTRTLFNSSTMSKRKICADAKNDFIGMFSERRIKMRSRSD